MCGVPEFGIQSCVLVKYISFLTHTLEIIMRIAIDVNFIGTLCFIVMLFNKGAAQGKAIVQTKAVILKVVAHCLTCMFCYHYIFVYSAITALNSTVLNQRNYDMIYQLM